MAHQRLSVVASLGCHAAARDTATAEAPQHRSRRGYSYSRASRRSFRGWSARWLGGAVNAVTVVFLLIGMPIFAIGVRDLQAKLERRDYQRHAQD